MQNRRWLVAFHDWQQMRKSAFDLRVKPELDDPDDSLLLGISFGLIRGCATHTASELP
jgi:hypothetical protein